jgi:hypothetical protein
VFLIGQIPGLPGRAQRRDHSRNLLQKPEVGPTDARRQHICANAKREIYCLTGGAPSPLRPDRFTHHASAACAAREGCYPVKPRNRLTDPRSGQSRASCELVSDTPEGAEAKPAAVLNIAPRDWNTALLRVGSVPGYRAGAPTNADRRSSKLFDTPVLSFQRRTK